MRNLEELQQAYNEIMSCTASPDTEEYAKKWNRYREAGGSLDMKPIGIDQSQWETAAV